MPRAVDIQTAVVIKIHIHLLYHLVRVSASHKIHHAAIKYKITLSVSTGQCIWINGPFCGGLHNITIFCDHGLKEKLLPGEVVIADRGYQTSRQDKQFISVPNIYDTKETAKFKSQVRLQHEGFNGRLKKYALMEVVWKHRMEKHGWAFGAIAVMVQYHLENGLPLFPA